MNPSWLEAFIASVKTADESDFWVVSLVGIVIALLCWFFSFRSIKRARLIEDVPTSKVQSAAQGYVELIGHTALLDGPPIIAPLTKEHCAWYKYRIEERRRSGKNSRWVTVESNTSDALFLLEDETGSCVVNPDDAETTTNIKETWYGHDRSISSNFQRTSSGLSGFITMGRYRFTEWRFEEGEPLYAIGHFKTVGDGEDNVSLKEEVRELVSHWKRDPAMMAKFDSNQDGQIDVAEWDALRKAAHQEIIQSRAERSSQPAVNVMQHPRESGQPYLLSTVDPEKLVKRFRWTGRLLLLLAILGGGTLLYAINIRLAM